MIDIRKEIQDLSFAAKVSTYVLKEKIKEKLPPKEVLVNDAKVGSIIALFMAAPGIGAAEGATTHPDNPNPVDAFGSGLPDPNQLIIDQNPELSRLAFASSSSVTSEDLENMTPEEIEVPELTTEERKDMEEWPVYKAALDERINYTPEQRKLVGDFVPIHYKIKNDPNLSDEDKNTKFLEMREKVLGADLAEVHNLSLHLMYNKDYTGALVDANRMLENIKKGEAAHNITLEREDEFYDRHSGLYLKTIDEHFDDFIGSEKGTTSLATGLLIHLSIIPIAIGIDKLFNRFSGSEEREK